MLKTVALFFDGQTVHQHLHGIAAPAGMAVGGCYESIIRVYGCPGALQVRGCDRAGQHCSGWAVALHVQANQTAFVGGALALDEPRYLFAHRRLLTRPLAHARPLCFALP